MTGMNKTDIHNKNKKLLVASIAIVVALTLFATPIVAMDDVFATKKKGIGPPSLYLNQKPQFKTVK